MKTPVQQIMTTRVIWVRKEALDDEPGVLSGRPGTSETGPEIVRRIRHLQGVVAVRDRLDYPPPPESPRDRYDALASFPMD